MKNYLSRIVCVLLVIALALGGLWYVNGVLIMKRSDGILTMQDFYAQPDGTVDVLLVGNSHSGINIDTATLWDSRGIAAYDLWGGVQPLWNSYHYIVEALKHQTPRLIVLEVMASTSDYEYSEEQNQIKNTAGMRLSRNKIEAVRISAPEDRQLELLLGFPLYHGRFDELTMEDFQHFPWSKGLENFKGSVLRYGTGSYEFESAEGVSDTAPVMDKELEYLNRIIALCREEGVPLMLLKTPSLEREQTQPILNTVAEIAADNDLAFVNMNLMDAELGITAGDWSLDRHMNAGGARKLSVWLAEYVQREYGIPDRRGDAAYSSWDVNAHNVNNAYLAAVTDSADYFAELRRSGRALLVIKNSPWESDAMAALETELESVGVHPAVYGESANNAILIADTVTGENVPAQVEGESMTFTLVGSTLRVNFEYQDVYLNDKMLTWYGGSELTLVVFDTLTNAVVDTVGFNTLNGCALTRAEE